VSQPAGRRVMGARRGGPVALGQLSPHLGEPLTDLLPCPVISVPALKMTVTTREALMDRGGPLARRAAARLTADSTGVC